MPGVKNFFYKADGKLLLFFVKLLGVNSVNCLGPFEGLEGLEAGEVGLTGGHPLRVALSSHHQQAVHRGNAPKGKMAPTNTLTLSLQRWNTR